jgi:predicted RNA polymerase sigma factor
MDQLPKEVTGPLALALVRSVDTNEIARAFAVATEALINEAGLVDPEVAARLAAPLRELSDWRNG